MNEYARWAEPLSLSVHHIVSTNVDGLLDGVVVVAFPYESIVRHDVDYRLLGVVSRFDPDLTGRVVLEVQWGVTDVDTNSTVVSARRSRYETQAASAGGTGALAAAMNEALAQFSRDIAGEMEAILQD